MGHEIDFSNTGKYLLTGSNDKTIKQWNINAYIQKKAITNKRSRTNKV